MKGTPYISILYFYASRKRWNRWFSKAEHEFTGNFGLFGHLLGCSTTSKVWIIYSHNLVALLIISKHLASIDCFKPS